MSSRTTAKKADDTTTPEPTLEEVVLGFDPDKVSAELADKGLWAKIAWVQQHVGHVDKTGEVRFGQTKFKHMQEHGLIGVLRPLWRIAGLAVIPGMDGADSYSKNGNSAIITIALQVVDTTDGASVTKYYTNEGVDNQDKAFNKAYTGAVKYALQKFFLVPTEQLDDNETVDVDNTRTAVAAQVAEITSLKPSDAEVAKLRGLMMENANKPLFPPAKVTNYLTATHGVERLQDLNKVQFRAVSSWVEERIAQGEKAE